MTYEKYIKKNGKVYGPYNYRSRRINGKVVSDYMGKEKNSTNPDYKKIFASFCVMLFIGIVIYGGINVIKKGMSGKIVLDVETTYQEDQLLTGILKVGLEEGELLPADSKVIIENTGTIYEYSLKDLISDDITYGNFYVEGKDISGDGDGYGINGRRKVYPDVSFILVVSSSQSSTEEISEETPTETPTEIPSTETPEETPTTPETPVETPNETPTEKSTSPETPTETTPATGNFIFNLFNSFLGIFGRANVFGTGQIVSTIETETEKTISKDNPFTYTLADGETASLKSGSVRSDGEQLPDSEVTVSQEGNVVSATTSYSKEEKGFGADYLTDNVGKEIIIDLSVLNITPKKGELKISLVYNDVEIISANSILDIEGEVSLTNETIINETLNETIEIELNQTFLSLTSEEREILLNKFGNESVKVVKSEVYNGELIIKNSIGNYWVEFTYKYNGAITDKLRRQIENDRVRWLKDIARKLSAEDDSSQEIEEFIGNYSIGETSSMNPSVETNEAIEEIQAEENGTIREQINEIS